MSPDRRLNGFVKLPRKRLPRDRPVYATASRPPRRGPARSCVFSPILGFVYARGKGGKPIVNGRCHYPLQSHGIFAGHLLESVKCCHEYGDGVERRYPHQAGAGNQQGKDGSGDRHNDPGGRGEHRQSA